MGRLIAAHVAGARPPGPFVYRHAGNLATIGRKAAVCDFGWLHLSGRLPAWLLWASAHVYFLIGWRHRMLVSLQWAWSYLTFERGARLITAAPHEAQPVDSSSLPLARTAA